jgi:hypothetical protein
MQEISWLSISLSRRTQLYVVWVGKEEGVTSRSVFWVSMSAWTEEGHEKSVIESGTSRWGNRSVTHPWRWMIVTWKKTTNLTSQNVTFITAMLHVAEMCEGWEILRENFSSVIAFPKFLRDETSQIRVREFDALSECWTLFYTFKCMRVGWRTTHCGYSGTLHLFGSFISMNRCRF